MSMLNERLDSSNQIEGEPSTTLINVSGLGRRRRCAFHSFVVIYIVCRFSVSRELGRTRVTPREAPTHAEAEAAVEAGAGEAARAAGAGGALGVVVVGAARIHRTRLLASLSGLKLEAELTSLQAALSCSRSRQCSLSGTLGRSMIVLLEGKAPNHQYVHLVPLPWTSPSHPRIVE